jgi:hypothetical protein
MPQPQTQQERFERELATGMDKHRRVERGALVR